MSQDLPSIAGPQIVRLNRLAPYRENDAAMLLTIGRGFIANMHGRLAKDSLAIRIGTRCYTIGGFLNRRTGCAAHFLDSLHPSNDRGIVQCIHKR